jgi:hypothetical protein
LFESSLGGDWERRSSEEEEEDGDDVIWLIDWMIGWLCSLL